MPHDPPLLPSSCGESRGQDACMGHTPLKQVPLLKVICIRCMQEYDVLVPVLEDAPKTLAICSGCVHAHLHLIGSALACFCATLHLLVLVLCFKKSVSKLDHRHATKSCKVRKP